MGPAAEAPHSRTIRWHDYITINAYWFSLTARAQTLTPLIIPLLVQRFVGEAAKGTFVGKMRLWALMAAVLSQALMGLLSDHSKFRWGRRRPFVVAGTLGELIVLSLIGLTPGLTGTGGYQALFGLYIVSMLTSNAAQTAVQGLMPDAVPPSKRGAFSGVKALLELPLPLIFVSLVVGPLIGADDLSGALSALMVTMVACMAITLFVPERARPLNYPRLDWRPLARLFLMTGAFTATILGAGTLVSSLIGPLSRLSLGLSRLLIGSVGLVGMGAAAVSGVWAAIRVSFGHQASKRASFTWWIVNRLVFLVAANGMGGFMLFFLQERFAHLSAERAAGPATTAMMLVGVCLLITALPSGWLADRADKRLLVAISGGLATVGMFIVMLVPGLGAVYGGGCLIGTAIGLFYPANWALGTTVIPQGQAGRYLGLSNLAGAGAGAIGAYIGGPIADQLGYAPLFGVYGTLFLLSALALTGIRDGGSTTGKLQNSGALPSS